MAYAWTFGNEAMFRVPGRDRRNFPEIEDETFWAFYETCAPFSMVHVTGFLNVYQALRYIKANALRGSFVECGCHMGGMGLFLALVARHLDLHRRIVLFDTFNGFPLGEKDEFIPDATVISAEQYPSFVRDVRENIRSTLGSTHVIELVEGDVAQTVPVADVDEIALLRLDTDFYASTKIELAHLYPKLMRGGLLTIDDYGVFRGARRATDEYFAQLARPPLLNRIDGAVWSGVKP